MRRYGAEIVLHDRDRRRPGADDGDVLSWERLKLIVEPTGTLGAAAAFEGTIPIAGRRVGIILTGGNVDLREVPKWIPAP